MKDFLSKDVYHSSFLKFSSVSWIVSVVCFSFCLFSSFSLICHSDFLILLKVFLKYLYHHLFKANIWTQKHYFLMFTHFHLFERQNNRDRDTEIDSINWITSQMLTKAKTQNQDPGSPSRPHMSVAGAQVLAPSSAVSHNALAGSWIRSPGARTHTWLNTEHGHPKR